MLPITYTAFPALLWSSFDAETAPEILPVIAYDPKVIDRIKQSKEFHQLFALLGSDYYQGNGLKQKILKIKSAPGFQPHTHLYLLEEIFDRVDNDDSFRRKHWGNVLKLPSVSGTVLFGEGGTYLFRIGSIEDTKFLSDSGLLSEKLPFGTRWFCVGFFRGDEVLGFEHGFLSYSNGIAVQDGGLYKNGSERGQFISFVGIALSYFHFGNCQVNLLLPDSENNKTNQNVKMII